MANVLSSNTYYVDTASSSSATALLSDDVQLVGLLYHSDSANQHVVLNDVSGQDAVGNFKLKIGNVSAHETVFLDFSTCPIRFSRGIWISTIESGYLTLIVKFK